MLAYVMHSWSRVMSQTLSLRGESGCQSEKTLAECMRYMLDNEIASDVCFEVGPSGGATVNILAHKYMLIARSPVFEAMFSSGMTECRSGPDEKIRIEDIDAAAFKDLLLYIYCEDVPVDVETASSLMYAANKYLLPKLVMNCRERLWEGLTVNNVIQVLEPSLLFDDHELKTKCMQLIFQNAHSVLTGTEILSATPKTMETIFQLDKIPVKEIVIYETCLAWAKHQHKIQKSTKNPATDQQLREILGDLLYKIRFPIMDGIEFAELSEGNSILTAEEKTSIYYYITTKNKGSNPMFDTGRRFSEETWVERANGVQERSMGRAYQWSSGAVDAINFTTNQDILLTGIGLYTGYNGNGYNVDVEVLQSSISLFKKTLIVPATGDANQFKVSMKEMIPIKAGVVYSVTAAPHGTIGYCGQSCQVTSTKGKVTFTFSQNQQLNSWTNLTSGQIPRLYFSHWNVSSEY